MVISSIDDIKISNFFMITFISIILIISIIIFLLLFKRKSIFKLSNKSINYKDNLNKNNKIKLNTPKFQDNFQHHNDTYIYLQSEKYYLKQKMYKLFKGSKEEKLKALYIAKDLSDKSTLKILRIGLKDMDPDIVKLSAKLIENFK